MTAEALTAPGPGAQSPADEALIPGIGPAGALYPIGKMAAHRAGAFHLAVSVFVFDGDDLLIQQRAAGKYHCALQWANTCCSHPHWGEPPAAAAARRLREELGLSVPLTPADIVDYRAEVTDGLIEHERVHVFRAEVQRAALRLAPDPAEVAATRWADRRALQAEAHAAPERFAPWFRIYLDRWEELGL